MIESRERGQIKLSSTCFVTVDQLEGRWSVDIRKYKLKVDPDIKGPMRSPTEKGMTLSYNSWGRLYLKLSAIGKALL